MKRERPGFRASTSAKKNVDIAFSNDLFLYEKLFPWFGPVAQKQGTSFGDGCRLYPANVS